MGDERSAQNCTVYEPTKAEQKLLEVLLNPEHRLKSITEICAIADIERGTYYNAFRKPEFVAHYQAEALEMVKHDVGPILNAYRKEAKRGSVQHGNVLLEMAGLYTPKKRQEITGANGGPVAWEGIRPRDEVEQRLREMGLLPQDEEKGEG